MLLKSFGIGFLIQFLLLKDAKGTNLKCFVSMQKKSLEKITTHCASENFLLTPRQTQNYSKVFYQDKSLSNKI